MKIVLLSRKKITLLLLLILGATTAYTQSSSKTSELALHMEEILIITGAEEPSQDMPFITYIGDVTTDSSGNIYIADTQSRYIHAYDSTGILRWTVGGQGPGPGEYDRIATMFVGFDNHLHVYDWEKAMVTTYDENGERIDNWAIRITRNLDDIRPLGNDRYLVPYKTENQLIQIYSGSKDKFEESLVDVNDILQTDNEYEESAFLTGQPGYAVMSDENQILYVPSHYDGKLLVYSKENADSWHRTNTIEGYDNIVTTIAINTSTSPIGERNMMGFEGQEGFVLIDFHSISFGLYPQDDGSLMHLSYRSDEEGMYFVVEEFDTRNMKLESFHTFRQFNLQHRYRMKPIHVDHNGHIYMADNRGDYPKLRVFTISEQ